MALSDRTLQDSRCERLFADIRAGHREWVLLEDGKPQRATHPASHLVSEGLIGRLRESGFDPPAEPGPGYFATLEQWLMRQDNSALQKIGLGRQLPPAELHYIHGGRKLFFDLRNADVLAEDLQRSGQSVADIASGFDFGCSTGRTLRTFAAGLPGVDWSGADPSPPSIEYAAKRFPRLTWQVSMQDPPLKFEDESFDMIFAKSIWTHFSATAAKKWLEELARVTRIGGRIAITIHGWHDLSRRIVWANPAPQYTRLAGFETKTDVDFLETMRNELAAEGFAFRPYATVAWQGDLGAIEDASTVDWGLTFMTDAWVRENLASADLPLVHHGIARTGHRHDVIVFERRR